MRFNKDLVLDAHRFQIFHGELRGHRPHAAKSGDFSHRFIQEQSDDSAMCDSSTAAVTRAQYKTSHDLPPGIVLVERQLHARFIRAAAPKAAIRGIRLQSNRIARCTQTVRLVPLLRLSGWVFATYCSMALLKPKPRDFARRVAPRADAFAFRF